MTFSNYYVQHWGDVMVLGNSHLDGLGSVTTIKVCIVHHHNTSFVLWFHTSHPTHPNETCSEAWSNLMCTHPCARTGKQRHFLHSAQDSSPDFTPPASYMSILQEELYILLILLGILVYNMFNPLENSWSCWMHSGIRFLESSKLNDPECDGVLPLKWCRMQCQNWSKSFRARNMQSTLEGDLGICNS